LNTKKTYDDEKNMVKVKTGYWDHHHKVNWLLGSPPQGKLVTGITTIPLLIVVIVSQKVIRYK